MRWPLAALVVLLASIAGARDIKILNRPPRQDNIQHAPTVEQCRADEKLWLSKLEQPGPMWAVSYQELTELYSEMTDCEPVDPENGFRFYNTGAEVVAEESLRLQHFLNRHHLGGQFLAEDAAGKR